MQSIFCSNIPCAVLDVVIEPVATAGEGAERWSTIIPQGIGGLVERSRRVNVVEGRGRWWWLIPRQMKGAPGPVDAAAPAQHQASGQAEAGRGVTEIHCQANLILQPAGEEGVVEIHNNIVSGPGHGDQAEQAGTEETNRPT